MKFYLLLAFALFTYPSFTQTTEFEDLLKSGKDEFKKAYEEQNYSAAVQYLEQAVKLKPENAEAHYFLGYAYERLNGKDGETMTNVNLSLILKSSEEFETVIKLEPKYKGEIIELDPYSKIGSVWGSLAMSYLVHNNDSAIWAFKEGKHRGGFGEFYLSLNRFILENCSQNAILISSGDNFTINLWYLQVAEKLRPDISVIDISLLNSTWYYKYLLDKANVKFDLENSVLDTIQYCVWSDSTIIINNANTTIDFSWLVKPSYSNFYLLRSDRLLLSILNQNKFRRDIYFTTAFGTDAKLSLNDFMKSYVLFDKLNAAGEAQIDHNSYLSNLKNVLKLVDNINSNSRDDIWFLEVLRYNILSRIASCIDEGKIDDAKELNALMEKKIPADTFPYQDENLEKYARTLFDEN